MVLNRLTFGVRWLLAALDSEGVALFQTIVYLHLACAGLYSAFVSRGVPQAVEATMGPVVNAVWMWMCIGALLCVAGKSVTSAGTKYWTHISGLLLQLTGDMFAFGAFTGYVLATIQDSEWGKVLVAVWVMAGLADCAALLVVRDIRRIAQMEKAVRA